MLANFFLTDGAASSKKAGGTTYSYPILVVEIPVSVFFALFFVVCMMYLPGSCMPFVFRRTEGSTSPTDYRFLLHDLL